MPLETRITLTFNVDDSNEGWCSLYSYDTLANIGQLPNEIEIDGVQLSSSEIEEERGEHQFATIGEHIVKIGFEDNTFIPYAAFNGNTCITEVIIPDCVVSIGQAGMGGWVFSMCTSLTSLIFNENTLQHIEGGSFCACPLSNDVKASLNNITQGATECD